MTTTINDILISELDRAVVPATAEDELVINQADGGGNFVTRRISWGEVGQSIRDLSGSIDRPDISNQVLFADGLEPQPSITFKNDQSTGIYRPILSLPALGISAGGYEVLRVAHDGTQGKVGIGFQINDATVPIESLHIKEGGIFLDYGLGLNFKITNDFSTEIGGTANESNIRLGTVLPNNLKFQTNGKERARVTKDGKFLIHGAIGVDGYASENIINPDFGQAGDANQSGSILISRGPTRSTIWMEPGQFFDQNVNIIGEIIVNNPDFIDSIVNEIDLSILGDILIDYPGFIDGIIDKIDIDIDVEAINEGLDKLNVDEGVEVVTGAPGTTYDGEFYLRADYGIARGTYNGTKNTEFVSDKIEAKSNLIFADPASLT